VTGLLKRITSEALTLNISFIGHF